MKAKALIIASVVGMLAALPAYAGRGLIKVTHARQGRDLARISGHLNQTDDGEPDQPPTFGPTGAINSGKI
jgi:hypothetical protein